MTNKPKPVLPPGTGGIFSGISENLSFHASPESFIQSQILRYHNQNPEAVQRRSPVRSKILNRNVVIVSAYEHIKQILEDNHDSYEAVAPYMQFMQEFFPVPNLLLADGCPHREMKSKWQPAVHRWSVDEGRHRRLQDLSLRFVAGIEHNTPVDLYDTLKDFAWELLLAEFISLNETENMYKQYISLQENLLRGQFSLFPVSVNAGFWHSPKKKGIDARKKLQGIICQRMLQQLPGWVSGDRPAEEIVNHILMATSSLAAKGLASLLTAYLLNLHVFEAKAGTIDTSSTSRTKFEVVLKETMRLSTPVVGIMRRATKDSLIPSGDETSSDILIPAGYDVWPYFTGANRDPAVFGDDADLFDPQRFAPGGEASEGLPEPIVFGLGPKRCLGERFVNDAALALAEAFETSGMKLDGQVEAKGVRAWLGWEVAPPVVWAKDLKQLPVQRPSKPIRVQLVSSTSMMT